MSKIGIDNVMSMAAKDLRSLVVKRVDNVNFVLSLYGIQASEGRCFLHEHPDSTVSWSLPSIRELLGTRGVFRVRCDDITRGIVSWNVRERKFIQ